MEEALIEVPTRRRCSGIDLISERIPDETMILTFQYLLGKHGLGEKIPETVKAHLNVWDMTMRQVAIVDATLIAARTSIKNNEVKRDPYADALAQEGQSVVLRDESPCWGGSGPWPDPLGCHQFRQCTGPRARRRVAAWR